MTEIILDEKENWETRILCSDESCIGTIGPDGKCRECGRVYTGELPSGTNAKIVDKPIFPDEQQPSAAPVLDDDWDKRVLCSDESCIGVIGPDGKCKECGKSL